MLTLPRLFRRQFCDVILLATLLFPTAACNLILRFKEISPISDSAAFHDAGGQLDAHADAHADAALDMGTDSVAYMDLGIDMDMKHDTVFFPGGFPMVSAGSFYMGSPSTESCRNTDNETQHLVTLTRSFEIAQYEVSQFYFKEILGYEVGGADHNLPVYGVSWHEAVAYCNKLSEYRGIEECFTCSGRTSNVICMPKSNYQSGNIYSCPGYRLPTEAEWEYAYRGGTTTALYTNKDLAHTCASIDANADEVSWHVGNSAGTVHELCTKAANPKSLCNMAGNVSEWCNDFAGHPINDFETAAVTDPWGIEATYFHIIRGGSCASSPTEVRAAARKAMVTTDRTPSNFVGFRCARTITY